MSVVKKDLEPNYRNDSKQLGRCLLTASNLSEPDLISNDTKRIAIAGKRYSPAWTNFLRDLILNPMESTPDPLEVYCKSSPI